MTRSQICASGWPKRAGRNARRSTTGRRVCRSRTAQELCAYWANDYDFAAAQERLNRFPQYRIPIDGLEIHFLHVPSRHEGAMPIVLTHGWPGSFVEFLGVIDVLANPEDPADAFHVVVPSLPGYGYSGKPSTTGWNLGRVAAAWDTLMLGLGYERYGAQGGDWGALVTNTIARDCAGHVTGVHLNLAVLDFSKIDMSDATPEEQEGLARVGEHSRSGAATQSSSPPAPRPWATGSPTRPRPNARGSSRSTGRGPIAMVTRSAR